MGKKKVHKIKVEGKNVKDPHDTSGTPAVHSLTNHMDSFLGKLGHSGLKEYSTYLSSPSRIFLSNFLAGIGRGLGFLFGVTILLSVLGFILTKVLGNIPIIGEFAGTLYVWMQDAVDQTKNLR